MSGNETTREPDNVLIREMDGNTYIVRQFFDGTNTLEDIIVKRILQDTNLRNSNGNPRIPIDDNR